MNLQDFEKLIDQYRTGELPEQQAAEVEAFMLDNPQARQACASDEELGALLRASLTDYPPVSPDRLNAVARRAMLQIQKEAAHGRAPASPVERIKPATWGLVDWIMAPLRQPQLAAGLAGVFIVGALAGWGLRPQVQSLDSAKAAATQFPGNTDIASAPQIPPPDTDSVIQPVSSSIIQKSALLENLQPVKYNLLASGNNQGYEQLRKFENEFAQMMPSETQPPANSKDQSLAAYQAGETALLEGNTAGARAQFKLTRDLDKKGMLGFLATMNLANLAFEDSQDYPLALSLFESCLNDYPASFVAEQNKVDVQKKVELITRNSADDYRPLRLYNQALNSKPDLARVHFEQLMTLYPNSTVAGEAVDQLLHYALDYPDKNLLPANDALNMFIVFVEKFPEARIVPRVQVAMGDIYLYRLQRTQQAMLLYTSAMEQTMNKDPELTARVNNRVQYIVNNGLLGG